MAFERVARLSEIPEGRAVCVRVGAREVGLFRVGGRVYAMDNVCPHAGYPLHEGVLEGTVVICSGHGWEYDLETGRPPGVADDVSLERFRVEIDGDEVLIDLEAPLP